MTQGTQRYATAVDCYHPGACPPGDDYFNPRRSGWPPCLDGMEMSDGCSSESYALTLESGSCLRGVQHRLVLVFLHLSRFGVLVFLIIF